MGRMVAEVLAGSPELTWQVKCAPGWLASVSNKGPLAANLCSPAWHRGCPLPGLPALVLSLPEHSQAQAPGSPLPAASVLVCRGSSRAHGFPGSL